MLHKPRREPSYGIFALDERRFSFACDLPATLCVPPKEDLSRCVTMHDDLGDSIGVSIENEIETEGEVVEDVRCCRFFGVRPAQVASVDS